MKKLYLYLLLAALVGLCPVFAKPGVVLPDTVRVSLNHKNISGAQRFVLMGPMPDNNCFKGLDKRYIMSSIKDSDKRWFVFNVPISVAAAAKQNGKSVAATIVPELTVKVYLLYRPRSSKAEASDQGKNTSEEASKYRLLEKKITYVDIPLNSNAMRQNGKEYGYVEMSVGVFIPLSVAMVMNGDSDPNKVASGNSLQVAAFAIEAEVDGTACKPVPGTESSTGKQRPTDYADAAFEKMLSSKGGSKWWTSGTVLTQKDARLYCISETPYAPFYGTVYPATKPLYGAPESAEAQGGAGETSSTPEVPSLSTDI